MWFSCQRSGDAAHVRIFGEIGIGQTGRELIAAIGDARKVQLVIDCIGGNSSAAMEIYEFLATRETQVEVAGRCYSSGLFLAMGGRRISARPDARFLIHSPVNYCVGNAETLATESKFLRKLTDQIALAISERTRQPLAIAERWLSADTYFDSVEALEAGLIDEILPPAAARAAHAAPTMAPDAPDGPPRWTDEERLLLDFLQALGPLAVGSRARLGRELGAWLTSVREN